MKKFIVLYQAPVSAIEQMAKANAEQSKAGMDAWMSWAKKAGSAIVDLGMPLGNGSSVGKGSVSKSTTTVAGFSILQADSMNAVTRVLDGHPHLTMPGATIEVLEGLPLPGM
ncbi:MAG: hypothetical protein ACKVPX_17640 [Myxococcaceae bacterium]